MPTWLGLHQELASLQPLETSPNCCHSYPIIEVWWLKPLPQGLLFNFQVHTCESSMSFSSLLNGQSTRMLAWCIHCQAAVEALSALSLTPHLGIWKIRLHARFEPATLGLATHGSTIKPNADQTALFELVLRCLYKNLSHPQELNLQPSHYGHLIKTWTWIFSYESFA